MQAPAEDGSPWLTAALTGMVLGTIAYRRPRAAGFFVGAVALATAPFLGFTAVTVNRFSKVGHPPLPCGVLPNPAPALPCRGECSPTSCPPAARGGRYNITH